MVSHCYGLMAKGRKCANLPKRRGTDMDNREYLDAFRDAATWLVTTLSETVSAWVVGGWNGILAFGAFAILMFVLTSLMTSRR